MPRIVRSAARRFLVSAALLLGAMLAPASAFPPIERESAESVRLAGFGDDESIDRHIHGDGEPEDRRAGHVHADDAADHSQERAVVLGGLRPIIRPRDRRWLPHAAPGLGVQARRRLDRPPRAFLRS